MTKAMTTIIMRTIMTTAATPPFFFDVPLSAVSDSLVDFSSTVEISSSEESRSDGTAAGTGPKF